MIYTDQIPIQERRQAVEKAIKTSLAAETKTLPFHVYHHASTCNAWLQVADYCCWAVHRKHEHGDDTYYNLLRPRLAETELLLWP